MSALIDDLFELARLEAGEVTWTPEPVGLAALVAETVDALAPEAGAHGVELRSEIATALPAAHASPEKLQRVLFNLVHNGIRHTPAGGTVTVRAASADGSLEIEVADTGAGIAEDDRARVFDAFFRGGHETARGTSGAGLGLAIARALVEAHGGRIWLATVERGTSVRFSVPRWAARAGSPHLR
jgi:signal transduction histidine kinase